jgi:hypothetical protein
MNGTITVANAQAGDTIRTGSYQAGPIQRITQLGGSMVAVTWTDNAGRTRTSDFTMTEHVQLVSRTAPAADRQPGRRRVRTLVAVDPTGREHTLRTSAGYTYLALAQRRDDDGWMPVARGWSYPSVQSHGRTRAYRLAGSTGRVVVAELTARSPR